VFAAIFLYLLYVVSAQTLLERASTSSILQTNLDEEAQSMLRERDAQTTEEDEADIALASYEPEGGDKPSKSLVTISLRGSLLHLKKECGLLGSFRALPAQIFAFFCSQAVFFAFGGASPLSQVAYSLLRGHDIDSNSFAFSPIASLAMVSIRLIFIPCDVIITRQIIGKPDNSNLLSLSKHLVQQCKIADFAPIIFPTLCSLVFSMMMDNTRAWLHFEFFSGSPTALSVALACLTNIIYMFTYFIMAPIQTLQLRSHLNVISRLPKFAPLIHTQRSYAGIGQELINLIQEERKISSTWYGRFLRWYKIWLYSGFLMFMTLLVVLPLALYVRQAA
jgi:hypothetical protein